MLSSDYVRNTLGYDEQQEEEEEGEPEDPTAVCQYKIKCWCPKSDCSLTHLTIQSDEGKAVLMAGKKSLQITVKPKAAAARSSAVLTKNHESSSPIEKQKKVYGNFVRGSSNPVVDLVDHEKNDYLSAEYVSKTLGYELSLIHI